MGMLLALFAGITAAHAQDAGVKASITVGSVILVEPALETPFPIQVGPTGQLPRNCFVRIRGLPRQATLSDGNMIAAGSWAVPLSGLRELKLTAPQETSGKSDLQISLVAIDGTVMAETKATLLVAAAGVIAPATTARAEPTAKAPAAPAPEPAQRTEVPPPMASLGVKVEPQPSQQAHPAPQPQPPVQPQPQASQPKPPARVASRPAEPAAQPPVAAPAAAAPAPSLPLISAAERERATKLLRRGDEEMATGDIAAARLYFSRAAEAGLSEAALAMAATYDPQELARRPVAGLQPDTAEARKWYERARDLGAPGVAEALRRLGAN